MTKLLAYVAFYSVFVAILLIHHAYGYYVGMFTATAAAARILGRFVDHV